GVLERRDGARLLMEPKRLFLPLRALVVGDAEPLQRDALARREVAAQVDDAHAALAQLANDLVAVREQRPDLALGVGRRHRASLALVLRRHGSVAEVITKFRRRARLALASAA